MYPWSEKGVGVGLRSHLGQAFRSGTGSLSRPVIMYLGWPRRMLSLRRLLGQVLQRSGSIGDPGFMNPTTAKQVNPNSRLLLTKQHLQCLNTAHRMQPNQRLLNN